MTELKLLGVSGSLRKGSYNTAFLNVAQGLVPEGVELSIYDWRELPMFDADLLADEPAPVTAWKNAIAEADGVLIATPEYNHSIPGPLKNALDWASRPAFASVFVHKPVAHFGAAGSTVGTARAQMHLETVLLSMVADLYPSTKLCIGSVQTRFGDDGELRDEQTRALLGKHVTSFAEWVRRRR